MKIQIIVPCIYLIIAVLALKFLLLTLSNPARGFALAEPLHIYQPIADKVEMSVELTHLRQLQIIMESHWPDDNVYLFHTLEFFSRGNWYVFPVRVSHVFPIDGMTFYPFSSNVSYSSLSLYYPLIVPGLYRVRFRASDSQSQAHYANPDAYRNRHDLVAKIFITREDAIITRLW